MASAAIPAEEVSRTAPDYSLLVPFGGALAVMAASLANLLAYHDYPFLRPEVGMVLAGGALLAIVFALIHRHSGPLTRAILEAVLVYLAIELNTEYDTTALVAAVTAGAAGFLLRFSLLPLLGAMAGAVILSALLGLGETRPPIHRQPASVSGAAAKEPAVLHVILDEHGGLASIRDPQVRAMLTETYSRTGFRLFTHAHSRHFHTVNAIPDVLNFGGAGESKEVDSALDVGRTAYLTQMERAGYRMHLYQSEFADFCRYSREASCTKYWSPSLGFVEPLNAPAREKARLIAYKLVALSSALNVVINMYDYYAHNTVLRAANLPWVDLRRGSLTGTLGGFAALDALTADVKSARSGELYFAHLLVPHYPYVVGPDCSRLPPSQWEYRHSFAPLKKRISAADSQMLCLAKQIDEMVAAFRVSPAGRDGIIILHGDHGSRITRSDPKERNRGRLTRSDMLGSYSTFFAVSSPTLTPETDNRLLATPDILRSLVGGRFASLDSLKPSTGEVFLEGEKWSVGDRAQINDAFAGVN